MRKFIPNHMMCSIFKVRNAICKNVFCGMLLACFVGTLRNTNNLIGFSLVDTLHATYGRGVVDTTWSSQTRGRFYTGPVATGVVFTNL